ncbi:8-amino-7-oxononanoate synthase [Acaryochloris thomasi RCC1774]|uniref:8-amino-7-ketopelargonate synthase n=1 Tax=Acaryochloris thomasi RCC1774 TaxID=1764569 RepID=A0A2W1JKI0_9CYAN|nr:8-amino-7-oxononanoate synthase [Acaryochloris thomasi RCC1774]
MNFASNDYLGLAGDERLQAAAISSIKTHGTGSTGSRLLSGHRLVHEELEGAISAWKRTEDAIVYSSGYLANIGTIAALVDKRDLIVGDEYNHSSLKNGAKLSGARILDYRHSNVTDLHNQLQKTRHNYRRCLLLTDSVFSMDGDLCPLPEILNLAHQYDCMVLVDEAHGTGVLGPTGAGCVEHFDCSGVPLIQMGTMSKALGSLGGYVAGTAQLIDYLRNRAATWIYTTGLSPADTAAALAAIQIIQSRPQRREQLWQNVAQLKEAISKLPRVIDGEWKLLPSDSPIMCLQMKSPEIVLKVSQELLEKGIYAPAIRPPTVPTSRIRFSVMATHQSEQIDRLATILEAG